MIKTLAGYPRATKDEMNSYKPRSETLIWSDHCESAIARFLKDPEEMLRCLAWENIAPVKAPPWADHPFELRRNEKAKRSQLGQHIAGKETAPLVIELLGIRDERSCKEVRERIKHLRESLGYR